jgi:hypothetical protein
MLSNLPRRCGQRLNQPGSPQSATGIFAAAEPFRSRTYSYAVGENRSRAALG